LKGKFNFLAIRQRIINSVVTGESGNSVIALEPPEGVIIGIIGVATECWIGDSSDSPPDSVDKSSISSCNPFRRDKTASLAEGPLFCKIPLLVSITVRALFAQQYFTNDARGAPSSGWNLVYCGNIQVPLTMPLNTRVEPNSIIKDFFP